MKIALYGMPCAGKSTLMDRITDAKVINGSQELRRICGGSFLELSEEEKHQVRIKYTEYINGLNDEVIVSDGHYSFMETVAFTEADGELYDIFIYLYCSPENLNNEVYDIVASNNYVVLSSGIKDLWSDIANAKNLGTIFASPYISADVKYYVVKQLREHGYTIFAYGDSKIDLYMLREADKGFLYIGKRISRSLKNESLSGLVPIYDHSLVILADEDEEVQADIAICKSNSGISGSRLAAAHVRLGEKIGRHIAAVFPEKNTSILVLERGGRFFGDGVYMGAGGIFYSMNPKQDDAPVINTERVVIVDSVINTGKSIMRIIDELKNHNPGIDVIIAANVIQNEAVELFKDYLVFATRLSKNSFVGVNQSKQTGKTGPDTADRLFNLIKKRY